MSLSVASEIALPGLAPLMAATSQVDLEVCCGRVPDGLTDLVATGPTWQMSADRFLLRIPGIARFLISNGRQITVAIEEGTRVEDVAIFLVGTVFGILMHQRERIVLHASAVCVAGHAVLFCGRSGAGKSTLAAALGRRGYPLVTDDLCAIDLEHDPPQAHPDGRALKLWAQAIDRLALTECRGPAVRSCLEKFYVPLSTEPLAAPVPIALIYGLAEPSRPSEAGIASPNVVDATLLVRSNAYRPSLVTKMGQRARYFHAATRLASQVGIYRLSRPFDFGALTDVLDWLEQHFVERGLKAAA